MQEVFNSMKDWIGASIEVIEFTETAEGGKNIELIDKTWHDDEGYAHCFFS